MIDTATPFARSETGPVEVEVGVAVVGAGFTGLPTALALAEKGAARSSRCVDGAGFDPGTGRRDHRRCLA